MKERFNRNVFKRLKRIEDLLNPSPNTHRITPEMQDLYDRIMMKAQNKTKPPVKVNEVR